MRGGVNTFGYVLGNPVLYTDKKGTSKDSVRNAFNEARADFPGLGGGAELSFNPYYMTIASLNNATAITIRSSINSNPQIVFSWGNVFSGEYSYLRSSSIHELMHADSMINQNIYSDLITDDLINADHNVIAPFEKEYNLWKTVGDRRGGTGKPDVKSLPWRNSCGPNYNPN